MKEHYSGLITTFLYSLIITLAVTFSSSSMGTEAGLQGWEVNQETIVNLFNISSQLESSNDDITNLLSSKNLIPVFQSLKVTSPQMSGFRGMASITTLPPEYGYTSIFKDHNSARQMQAQASYSSDFKYGSVNLWLGALWKAREINSITTGLQSDDEDFGYNIGIDLNYAGFSLTGSYFSGQAIESLYFNPYSSFDSSNCFTRPCEEFDNEGYVLKGAYSLTRATKLGISYGESTSYTGMNIAAESDSELWTVGLSHDVNSWLKIEAKYSNFKSFNYGLEEDTDMISVGGFIRW